VTKTSFQNMPRKNTYHLTSVDCRPGSLDLTNFSIGNWMGSSDCQV